jgi:DNA adenine methylase
MLKPLVKYQGGKSRELKTITKMMPAEYNRIVEPFCGGAALSFRVGKPAVLCDTNWEVINLYRTLAENQGLRRLVMRADELRQLDHDALEEQYYDARNEINTAYNPDFATPWHRAIAYITVRQLCFSGMERYNAKGEFNVPFGHYKKFACNLNYNNSGEYWMMLNCSQIIHGDFELALNEAKSDDFVFIDPPYLDRLGYHSGDGGDDVHSRLVARLKDAPFKWMIVHSDHDFYREQYKDFNIYTKDFQYAQRFGKDKNHSGASVQHLYITNYEAVTPVKPPTLHPFFP